MSKPYIRLEDPILIGFIHNADLSALSAEVRERVYAEREDASLEALFLFSERHRYEKGSKEDLFNFEYIVAKLEKAAALGCGQAMNHLASLINYGGWLSNSGEVVQFKNADPLKALHYYLGIKKVDPASELPVLYSIFNFYFHTEFLDMDLSQFIFSDLDDEVKLKMADVISHHALKNPKTFDRWADQQDPECLRDFAGVDTYGALRNYRKRKIAQSTLIANQVLRSKGLPSEIIAQILTLDSPEDLVVPILSSFLKASEQVQKGFKVGQPEYVWLIKNARNLEPRTRKQVKTDSLSDFLKLDKDKDLIGACINLFTLMTDFDIEYVERENILKEKGLSGLEVLTRAEKIFMWLAQLAHDLPNSLPLNKDSIYYSADDLVCALFFIQIKYQMSLRQGLPIQEGLNDEDVAYLENLVSKDTDIPEVYALLHDRFKEENPVRAGEILVAAMHLDDFWRGPYSLRMLPHDLPFLLTSAALGNQNAVRAYLQARNRGDRGKRAAAHRYCGELVRLRDSPRTPYHTEELYHRVLAELEFDKSKPLAEKLKTDFQHVASQDPDAIFELLALYGDRVEDLKPALDDETFTAFMKRKETYTNYIATKSKILSDFFSNAGEESAKNNQLIHGDAEGLVRQYLGHSLVFKPGQKTPPAESVEEKKEEPDSGPKKI